MTGHVNFGTGLNGIYKGLEGIEKTAGKIANKDVTQAENPQDLARSLVELKIYQHQVNASAAVVKITDQVLGALLDIKV